MFLNKFQLIQHVIPLIVTLIHRSNGEVAAKLNNHDSKYAHNTYHELNRDKNLDYH